MFAYLCVCLLCMQLIKIKVVLRHHITRTYIQEVSKKHTHTFVYKYKFVCLCILTNYTNLYCMKIVFFYKKNVDVRIVFSIASMIFLLNHNFFLYFPKQQFFLQHNSKKIN